MQRLTIEGQLTSLVLISITYVVPVLLQSTGSVYQHDTEQHRADDNNYVLGLDKQWMKLQT